MRKRKYIFELAKVEIYSHWYPCGSFFIHPFLHKLYISKAKFVSARSKCKKQLHFSYQAQVPWKKQIYFMMWFEVID